MIEPDHPEATCKRCGARNPSWHAPSPLWNAVMRNPETLADLYGGIVCPNCFAELTIEKGIDVHFHFGPHQNEDISRLWQPKDGRVWSAEHCLWLDPPPYTTIVGWEPTNEDQAGRPRDVERPLPAWVRVGPGHELWHESKDCHRVRIVHGFAREHVHLRRSEEIVYAPEGSFGSLKEIW